jgi:hypothetical protein
MLGKSKAGSGPTPPNTAIESDSLGEALRDADQASLTRRAVTDNSRALVDEVLRLIAAAEAGTRQRKRVSRAGAFRQVVEGFLGDLLAASGEGWVFRRDKDAPRHHFRAARQGLKKLGLLEETRAVQRWSPFGVVTQRRCRRFRATPQLRGLAAQHGIEPTEARKHFVDRQPVKPLRLRTVSRRAAPAHIRWQPTRSRARSMCRSAATMQSRTRARSAARQPMLSATRGVTLSAVS